MRRLAFKRGWRYALPASIIIFLGYFLMLQPKWIFNRLTARSPDVLYAVETELKLLALTIDDGPDPVQTDLILKTLAQHDARATFFVLADRIEGNEALIQRIVDEGHELGNHLVEDKPSIYHPASEFEQRLEQAHHSLSRFSEIRWFRPGSGWYNRGMIQSLDRFQYSLALGSIYPFDSHIPSSWFASRYIVWRAHPGAIIVLHDFGERGRRTNATLVYSLPILKQRGYRIVSLSELHEAASAQLD